MGGSFGLIIGSSDGGSGDDFGYFQRPGFQIGSVDGSVCVCVALLMALLALSDGFFFFFFSFPSVVTLGFFFFF